MLMPASKTRINKWVETENSSCVYLYVCGNSLHLHLTVTARLRLCVWKWTLASNLFWGIKFQSANKLTVVEVSLREPGSWPSYFSTATHRKSVLHHNRHETMKRKFKKGIKGRKGRMHYGRWEMNWYKGGRYWSSEEWKSCEIRHCGTVDV